MLGCLGSVMVKGREVNFFSSCIWMVVCSRPQAELVNTIRSPRDTGRTRVLTKAKLAIIWVEDVMQLSCWG